MASLQASPLPLTHKDTYPGISAQHQPELSQVGKTVLITGGGAGVGYFIASQFAKAGASTIVLVGRRQHVLESATKTLKAETPALKVHIHTVDVTDTDSTASLWKWINASGLVVDVLVLGHGRPSPLKTLLDLGTETVWDFYKINVRAHMDFAERFYKHVDARDSSSGQPVLINVSTAGIYDYNACGPVPVYSLTKNSGTMVLQQIAKDVPAEKLRIISYHPGLLKTDATKDLPFPPDFTPPWCAPELAGDFAVWLASPDATFLHGRFVMAAWDVDELRVGEVREQIEKDPFFLKVGVLGLHA